MRGIDISSYQSGLNAGTISADFVIVKATEGVGYVNPVCDTHYQQAINAGKKVGVYHFARNSVNTAEAEAEFFVKNIKGYIKHAVLVLDWEDATHDTAWAERWINKVIALTGVVPMIYMSESVVLSHDWSRVVALNVGLWVAKYRDMATDYNYNMDLAGNPPSLKWWKNCAMWQWTSSGRLDGWGGNLDCNEFYGDHEAWDKYAGGAPVPAPVVIAVPAQPPVSENYYIVQSGDNLSAIAQKYKTSWQHLKDINGLANENLIYAGQRLRVTGEPQARTYVVQSGDTLSSIASRYKTTWQTLQRINGIPDANIIHAGDVIRLG